jgi:hypothetical protein
MARDYVHPLVEWPERHPGLGGWVGALGAILAIFGYRHEAPTSRSRD